MWAMSPASPLSFNASIWQMKLQYFPQCKGKAPWN
jgi:hypothetical protein